MSQGVCYDRQEKAWGQLAVEDYVVARDGILWRVDAVAPDGRILVEDPKGEQVAWPAQDPSRMVPVAVLSPIDPLTLLRERMGATVMAWKPNDAGVWTAAPWYEVKPGNESIELYRGHLIEMHGFKPLVLDYDALRAYHLEHHTEGIAHKVPHTHPERTS